MPNEHFCLFHKRRLRTLCAPGLYWVNPGTVGVNGISHCLRDSWAREGGRGTVDTMKHGPSAIGSQKNTTSRKVSERI